MLPIAAALLLSGCAEEKTDYPNRQLPTKLENSSLQLDSGEKLFLEKCAVCHGKPSEGRSDRADFFEPPAPDFTARHYNELDPAYLYWRIDIGKEAEPYRSQGSVMPAWGAHLSEQQLWQLVIYLRARAE